MKHRVETEPWQFLYEETIGQVNWRSKINDVSYLNEVILMRLKAELLDQAE